MENERGRLGRCWDSMKCCRKNKVGDKSTNCCSLGRRKGDWGDMRQQSFGTTKDRCSKACCLGILSAIFCCTCCKKKPPPVREEPIRKQSTMSKKKSLTPASVPPQEDPTPKIDMSLVEHSSHMRGAIPILPVCLAWFCLILNCILPGTGTFFSGLFCLCLGIPRFSQKDGLKQRLGAFLINCIISFSQFFTVLFCLVGWGWSIWWGVIMLKVARKHKRFRELEDMEEGNAQPVPINNRLRDPVRK
nr:unnamed protein product [Callosobruchus analis]